MSERPRIAFVPERMRPPSGASLLPRTCLLGACLLIAAADRAWCGAPPPQTPAPQATTDAGLSSPAWREPLEQAIERIMRAQKVTGLAVGIVVDGKLAYARGFGVQSLETRTPVTERSLFHMASVTKPFVATAILQLVEEGEIALDAPVAKYLPYFRLADERASQITIRQLLSHTAGMPDVEDYEWDKPQYDDEALERYVRALADRTLIAAPGAKFQYSNIGFEVLADVIAKVSGETFEEYVQARILTPLAMTQSTLLVREADAGLLCSPHVEDPTSGAFVVSKVFPYNRPHAGSSTLYSSVLDMSRFACANLDRGRIDGEQILNGSSYDLLWTRTAGAPVGLSWFVKDGAHGLRLISHGGGDVGFRTNLLLVPERRLAVIALSNCTADAVRTVTDSALDLLLR